MTLTNGTEHPPRPGILVPAAPRPRRHPGRRVRSTHPPAPSIVHKKALCASIRSRKAAAVRSGSRERNLIQRQLEAHGKTLTSRVEEHACEAAPPVLRLDPHVRDTAHDLLWHTVVREHAADIDACLSHRSLPFTLSRLGRVTFNRCLARHHAICSSERFGDHEGSHAACCLEAEYGTESRRNVLGTKLRVEQRRRFDYFASRLGSITLAQSNEPGAVGALAANYVLRKNAADVNPLHCVAVVALVQRLVRLLAVRVRKSTHRTLNNARKAFLSQVDVSLCKWRVGSGFALARCAASGG